GVRPAVNALIEKISATGFKCKRCGKCCRGAFGDNTATVFPFEVRGIMEATGLGWLDIARPHESDDVDERGFFHTFEWALRKKENGDCFFLKEGGCAIYLHRPLICRTYPMRLEDGRLELYECDGLGNRMDGPDAGRMAEALMKRQLVEAREAASLLEKFEAFRPANKRPACDGVYVVHDSEGSRKVLVKDGGWSFI
ncbi:MAG TPA: YkgJ family cysteine cluster protein, partial [Methanocella sp.]|nr:YkgJ family cysteine cluster protein [Methanocella sp.]